MLIAADSCVLPRNFTGSFEDEHDYDDEHDLVADFGVSSVETLRHSSAASALCSAVCMTAARDCKPSRPPSTNVGAGSRSRSILVENRRINEIPDQNNVSLRTAIDRR
jgi:hypothetical protein